MTKLKRSAVLPYAADDVYSIVNDVARYPEFLPWCIRAVVLAAEPTAMKARLTVEAKGFKESFTTHNRLQPGRAIRLDLVDGPFSDFKGEWRFSEFGGGGGCRVELDLSFAFKGARRLLSRAVARSIGVMANAVMDAFCHRAHEQLGAACGSK